MVWSKFLLECQWFELGGVFGPEDYAFFEDALASGGLLRRSPYVNKVQHLFYGRMTSCPCTDRYFIIAIKHFCCVSSQFGCIDLCFTSTFGGVSDFLEL